MWECEVTKSVKQKLQAVYDELFSNLGEFGGSYIAGGSIVSLVLGEEPKDYDVWFETAEEWKTACTLAERAIGDFGEGPVEIICQTPHAMTFKLLGTTPVFQFVKSRTGDVETVIEQFDFLHAQAGFVPKDALGEGELYFGGRNCVDFIKEKVLVFAGALDYPIHTLSRLQKFALRGYKVPDQTLSVLVSEIRSASAELIRRDQNAIGMKYGAPDYIARDAAAEEFAKELSDDNDGIDFS